ncbi:hypothetical protein N8504_06365, partial [Akkermansiaceae bacterium]|nr:hypothetical protein [Akkermansiaceae bacterium]
MMKTYLVAFVSFFTLVSGLFTAPAAVTGTQLREVIVSHSDEKGILQLYRMNEDGTDRQQLTHSNRSCR